LHINALSCSAFDDERARDAGQQRTFLSGLAVAAYRLVRIEAIACLPQVRDLALGRRPRPTGRT
jgi:hypothetical protein